MVNKQLRVDYVTTKLKEGDFRGAVCTDSSEDSIAEIIVEVIFELKEKYLDGHPDSLVMQPPEESIQMLLFLSWRFVVQYGLFPMVLLGVQMVSVHST